MTSSKTLSTPLVVLLALSLAAVPVFAQKDKKTFSETTSVVVVEVPVTVTRDGEPLDGLTADNFELLDEKKKQEITGFELVDLKRIETKVEHPVPIAARRHFLMLFDLAWSQPESIVKARQAALELVDDLHPTDLAGVAVYTSTTGANLLLNFTSDRRQLELAIQTLGAPKLVERSRDPLGLVFGSASDLIQQNVADTGSDTGGLAGDAIEEAAAEQVLDMASQIASAERANEVNKISAFTGNLEALANLLANIEGRKHLVYFSEGIPSDILVGNQDDDLERQQTRAGTSIADVEATNSDALFGYTQSQNQLGDMVEQFRRAGCSIQSVDIGGLRALNEIGGRKSGEESLVSMARDTGGEFFRNFNDLGQAMEKMLLRTSVTYLLAFQPKNLKLDGDYHRLKVKLKDAPRGTRVSHRDGYYAPLPYGERNPYVKRLETAEIMMSDDEGGPIDLDVLAAAYPIAGEKAYVPVLLEVDGKSLVEPVAGDKLELEVYAYATNAESGAVYDFFVQTLGFDLTQHRGPLEQNGLKYWGHFDLPPGDYVARVMVRDRNDGRHTLQRQAVTVPESENAQAVLWPPLFPEQPGKWVLVREGEDRRRDVPYPFMSEGQPYIPAVKPVVPAKGSTPFFLRGLNLAGDVSFAGEVTSAEGTPVTKAALALSEPTAADGFQSVTAQLETKGLKPGEYTLVGKATDASGEAHSASIHFVVQ